MSFVKWGVVTAPFSKTEVSYTLGGAPIKRYVDIVENEKALIGLVKKLLTCCDDERDAAVMQEAHALLARIKGE